jgi:membrane associated rhomboid family serine protease
MPYNCRHCGGTFCSEHRLPENHGCPGLENWNDPDGVFDSGFDDSVGTGSDSGGRSGWGGSSSSSGTFGGSGGSGGVFGQLTPDTGPGGLTGYFRNNLSYLFLAVMVVVFLIQGVLLVSVDRELWRSIFTLTTANPEYVWTWVISVFSHGSPAHLLFNAIALYFFGPIVERQVGSKKFAALFLVSGVLAGLGQVGVGLVTGESVAVLGASGALMAIMGVLAVTSPDLKVLLFFFIPMSIRTLTVLFAAFSIFAFVSSGGVLSGVAHFAHLVGLVIGVWYGRRVKDRVGRGPQQLNLGPGRGPGGPGGPGRFP